MSVTDQVRSLFDKGVIEITLIQPPKGGICLQAKQFIISRGEEDRLNVVHQVVGATLPECLDQALKQVAHCNELKSLVVPVRGVGN